MPQKTAADVSAILEKASHGLTGSTA